MSISLQFDPHQKFQLAAIEALSGLFAGQPRAAGAHSFVVGAGGAGLYQTELGTGNRLDLSRAQLLRNLRLVQEKQGLLPDSTLLPKDPDDSGASAPLNYTVEMETGTGKTYVYLRAIRQLHADYGWSKFVVVVPSVAIREGVLQSMTATEKHLRDIYGGEPLDFFVYDGKKPAQLAAFARASCPTVCVINVQAFVKDSGTGALPVGMDGADGISSDPSNPSTAHGQGAHATSNVIYKPSDALPGGRAPIDFMQACNPIVIVDEPQSVDGTDKAKAALRRLNPLMTLRFSATHKEPFNVVYRLGPVKARQLKLVKGIVVASVGLGGTLPPGAYLKVESVGYGKTKKPEAKLRLLVAGKDGASQKSKTVKGGEDLFITSKEHEPYRGLFVEQVDFSRKCVTLSSGHELAEGQELGGLGDELLKLMVRKTVEKHLEKELHVASRLDQRRIKVLSLFFLDRVADYRVYDDAGSPGPGKVARWFEEALRDLVKQPRFAGMPTAQLPIEKLHDGYFAKDKKSKQAKESTEGRATADDNDAYELIMRDKGRLLDPAEPLRFLFSHSALREGWDNPNVFQICKLGGAQTVTRRRQELGRGLRLPVDDAGLRVMDERLNDLTVVGAEDYASFAKALQTELQEECGATFGKVLPEAFAALEKTKDGQAQVLGFEQAKALWETLRAVGVLEGDGALVPGKDLADLAAWLPEEVRPLSTEIEKVLNDHRLSKMAREDRPRESVRLNKRVSQSKDFMDLWEKISRKTRYRVAFDGEALVKAAVTQIKLMPEIKMEAFIDEGRAEVTARGVEAHATRSRQSKVLSAAGEWPDPILFLQNRTDLKRGTLAQILARCGRLEDFARNPQRFLDEVAAILSDLLAQTVVKGVEYHPIEPVAGVAFEQLRLDEQGNEEIQALTDRLVHCPERAAINPVECDSDTEKRFAEQLDKLEDVVCFVKLPRSFKVPTPVGDYNPDWALVKKDGNGEPRLFLVRETKGCSDKGQLRFSERAKVECAQAHFKALAVDYKMVVTADEL